MGTIGGTTQREAENPMAIVHIRRRSRADGLGSNGRPRRDALVVVGLVVASWALVLGLGYVVWRLVG